MPQVGVYGKAEADVAIAAHAEDPDVHHSSIHGADKHIDIARKLFLPATAGFVEAGTVALGSEGYYGVVRGEANTDTPKVHVNGRVPEDFVSFVALKAVWSSPAVSGNMQWYLKVALAPVGEYCALKVESPSPRTTATSGWNEINASEGGITFELAAKDDYFGISFIRQGSIGSDTLDEIMELYGFLFEYIANQ